MSGLDVAEWATILGTWVLVVGTLSFAYWQLRQAQRLHSATTLLELREGFYSPRMKRARRAFSTWLLDSARPEETGNWEVGVFFEQLGFLTRTGVLEKRMVWNAFGTWVAAYHSFLTQPENLLDQWRKEGNDPLIFREFEWLAREMMSFESRLLSQSGGSPYNLEDARFVLEVESRLTAADDSL